MGKYTASHIKNKYFIKPSCPATHPSSINIFYHIFKLDYDQKLPHFVFTISPPSKCLLPDDHLQPCSPTCKQKEEKKQQHIERARKNENRKTMAERELITEFRLQ